MELVLLAVVAIVALLPIYYVQRRLPVHARGQAIAPRLLLLAVGVGLGYVGALTYREVGGIAPWLAFFIGLGVAHLPAVFILLIKRERGEYDR